MENKYPYCQVIGQTDRGLKRAANEDHYGERQTRNGWVAVVCDGMGGHVGGATASHLAVDTILQFLEAQYFDDAREAIGAAIDAANAAILRYTASHPELRGMGSTCVLLIVRDGLVYLGHVGDSRIYLVRDHRIKQLTKDHSYVQMLVDAGQITAEQAEHHPRKNEITNALGLPQMQPATVMADAISPEAGDCFVLCSDGLSGMVSNATIEHVVSLKKELTAQQRANRLIEKAKEGGGLDNITAMLVEFATTPSAAIEQDASDKRKKITIWSVAAVLCLLIIGGLIWFLTHQSSHAEASEEASETMSEEASDMHIVEKQDTVVLQLKVPHKENGVALYVKLTEGKIVTICNAQQHILYGPVSIADEKANWKDLLQYNDGQVQMSYTFIAQHDPPIEQISFTPLSGIEKFSLTIQGKKVLLIEADSPLVREERRNQSGGNTQPVKPETSGPADNTTGVVLVGDSVSADTHEQAATDAPDEEEGEETSNEASEGETKVVEQSEQATPMDSTATQTK